MSTSGLLWLVAVAAGPKERRLKTRTFWWRKHLLETQGDVEMMKRRWGWDQDVDDFEDAVSEGELSGRAVASPLVSKVFVWTFISEYNETSRYFGVIDNFDGQDASVPRGLYFQAREDLIDVHDKSQRGLIQSLFFAPIKSGAIVRLGTLIDDYRPSHNLALIRDGSTSMLGVGGFSVHLNERSDVDAYRAPNLKALLDGAWRGLDRDNSTENGTTLRRVIFNGTLRGCHDFRSRAFLDKIVIDNNTDIPTAARRAIEEERVAGNPAAQEADFDRVVVFERFNKKKQITEKVIGLNRTVCPFDGKHSVIYHRDRYLVYSRSNLAFHGGRFIQVARSRTSNIYDGFERYRLISFLNYDRNANLRWGTQYRGSIYFGVIKKNPVDPSTLLGLFPVVDYYQENKLGYIGAAISCDGVHFSPLTMLLHVGQTHTGRTSDHPVDGFVQHDGRIFFFVHRNVPGIAYWGKGGYEPSIIAQYEFNVTLLDNFTHTAIAQLGGCHSPPVYQRHYHTFLGPPPKIPDPFLENDDLPSSSRGSSSSSSSRGPGGPQELLLR